MKHKFIPLILASMAIGALAACGPKAPVSTDHDLNNHWKTGPDELYEVSGSEFSYTNVDPAGYPYVGRNFSYDAEKISTFTKYKKFSFTAKAEVTAGSSNVMFKVEGAGGTFETTVALSAEPKTFEFRTSFISDWTKLTAIVIFANRGGTESGAGKITITRAVLSESLPEAQYDVAPTMPYYAQEKIQFNGGDELETVATHAWAAVNSFATVQEENGVVKANWAGKPAGSEYWALFAEVQDTANHTIKTSGFKRIVFTIKGDAGKQAIVKFEPQGSPAAEKTVELDGTQQVVELDIQAKVAAMLDDKDTCSVRIMPEPGQASTTTAGSLEIVSVKFDKVTPQREEIVKNTINFPGAVLEYAARFDNKYTLVEENHETKVHWKKTAPGWEGIEYMVNPSESWFNVADYKRVYLEVVADAKVSILVKPYNLNANEHWEHLTANEKKVIDFTFTGTAENWESQALVLMVCAGDDSTQALEGNITFSYVQLLREAANPATSQGARLVKSTWPSDASREFSVDANGNLVFTHHGEAWAETVINGMDVYGYNAITGTLKSDVATRVLIKPGDLAANEIWVDVTPEGVALNSVFAEAINYNFSKIMICAGINKEGQPAAPATATVTFENVYIINRPAN